MKKVWICLGLMVVCIITSVFLNQRRSQAVLEYEKVQVQVVSSEARERTVRTRYSTTRQTVYEVVVRYNGKDYDLKNAHSAASYRKGSTVTVYFAGGKMYADEAGVRSSTAEGIAYSVSIFATFGMFILSMVFLAQEGQKKQRAKNPPPQVKEEPQDKIGS